MAYPKDPFYQKQAQQSQMAPPPGQYPPPMYPSAPPPYSAVPSQMPGSSTVPQYPTNQYAYGTGIPLPAQPYPPHAGGMQGAPPPYNYQPQSTTFNPGYPVQQGFNYAQPVQAHAVFDSGARFDGIASQNIPPPPPGCAPNAAQMTLAQGGSVTASQKKANWFSGSGGGVSFW